MYGLRVWHPISNLLSPPPYARVVAPFLEGGLAELLCIWTPPGVGICITHDQSKWPNPNVCKYKKNKKGSCKLWQLDIHLYDDNRRSRYSPFFSTGGAISCSVCFRVVCKQNGPEKLVPERERGREKSLSISFVAVLRNGRNDVKRLPSLPCRQATTVIRILFVQRDRPAITFFSFFVLLRSFFIVWCSCGHKVHPLRLWTLRL